MTLPSASPDRKSLVLGTALWGWGVDRSTAYDMLDRFFALGGRIVDTAANYPINRRPEDFGLAAAWIADWIAMSGVRELSILVKVGATDNMGGGDTDLRAESLLDSVGFFRGKFGSALAAIALHWDNRGGDERGFLSISETLHAMAGLEASGLSVGFSGVRFPDLYLKAAPELSEKWWIQVKENILSNSARLEYQKYFPKCRYLAYGINMGGVKVEPASEGSSLTLRGLNVSSAVVRQLSSYMASLQDKEPAPASLNELALLHGYVNSALSGIIVGPRNVQQLDATMKYWERLTAASAAGAFVGMRDSCLKK